MNPALSRLLGRLRRRAGWATIAVTAFTATNLGPTYFGPSFDRRPLIALAVVLAASWLALWVVTELRLALTAEGSTEGLQAPTPPVGECPDQPKPESEWGAA